ncbi:MAG: hypothetical protein AB7Y46_03845 [Armatimonadota bacterium]
MALSSGQRRHLISAYATIGHLLRQMEEAGSEGRSPTGVASPLAPLAPEEVDAICGPIRRLQARLRERAQALAPAELAAFERPQGAHNTRIWLSNLLEKIRSAVDSLQPRQMRNYGVWTRADERDEENLHNELAGLVREAREELEHRL